MPCYHPIRAALVKSFGKNRLEFGALGELSVKRGCGKAVSLPCGRCIGCRLEHARQWAVRVMHEAKLHDVSLFLTLTYADDHLPSGVCNCRREHVCDSICVDDFQKFMKRLREAISPVRIRFFACGEYGDKRGRPHYHAVIFGWWPPDCILLRRDEDYCLFDSPMLERLWGNGLVAVGRVSFESAAYVASYETKKITGKKAASHYKGRSPEWLLMSRKPGIGRGWLQKFSSDVFPSDEVIVRGKVARPPRYYSVVAEEQMGIDLSSVRAKREAFAEQLEDFVLQSGETVRVAPGNNARRLAVREVVAKAKLALSRRKLEA